MTKAAVGLSMLAMPSLSFAQTSSGGKGLNQATSDLNTIKGSLSGTGAATASLPQLVGNIINVILSVMGILFVILIVYAGILYMSAGTNPDNAKKAKGLILNAIIGLVIVIASYAISSFIIQQLVTVGA